MLGEGNCTTCSWGGVTYSDGASGDALIAMTGVRKGDISTTSSACPSRLEGVEGCERLSELLLLGEVSSLEGR